MFAFEKESEIEDWLREQWAGSFKDMLRNQKEMVKVDSISKQVTELGSINTTLKHYLETLINRSDTDDTKIIAEEFERLKLDQLNSKLMEHTVFTELISKENDITLEGAKEFFKCEDINAFANKVSEIFKHTTAEQYIKMWRQSELINDFNKIRNILLLPPFV